MYDLTRRVVRPLDWLTDLVSGRRKLRKIALQALYEIDSTSHEIGEVLERHSEEQELTEEGRQFFTTLVNGVLNNKQELDVLIHQFAPEWPVDQMAVVDRNILRMAIFELAFYRSTPVKVTINEAVELAKTYASENVPRFVNGVLGSMAADPTALDQLANGTDLPAPGTS